MFQEPKVYWDIWVQTGQRLLTGELQHHQDVNSINDFPDFLSTTDLQYFFF